MMVNQGRKLCLAATLATALAATATTTAQAAVISSASLEGCPTASCVSFQEAGFDVTGGGVVNDGASIKNRAKTPGSNFGFGTDVDDSASVSSYNVLSVKDVPEGAKTAMTVSGLDGILKVFWGSVDTHNVINFNDGTSISGLDIGQWFGLGAADANRAGNFRFDAFVTITGYFSEAVFGVDKALGGNGIAFEVATSAEAVPEPLTILGTTAALGMGVVMRRKKSALS